MEFQTFMAFASELTKVAAETLDPDIRRLLAERLGEEYLEGGKIPETETLPKFANMLANNALGLSNFKAKKKDDSTYQHVRDWGWRGVQGAAAGAGLTQLAKNIRGGSRAQMHSGDYRRGAAIGAGVAIGDRLWRHRKEKAEKQSAAPKRVFVDFKDAFDRQRAAESSKTAMVNANPGASFRSPANELAESGKTGLFKSKVIHTGAVSKPLQLGKKFPMPGAL